MRLTFNPDEEKVPVIFNILSDDVSEGTESFRLVLSIGEAGENIAGLSLNISSSSTTININDDDGKFSLSSHVDTGQKLDQHQLIVAHHNNWHSLTIVTLQIL